MRIAESAKNIVQEVYYNRPLNISNGVLRFLCAPLYISWKIRNRITPTPSISQTIKGNAKDPDILVVVLGLNLVGGSDKSILNYVEELERRGKKVRVEIRQQLSRRGKQLLKSQRKDMVIIVNGLKSFLQDSKLSSIGCNSKGWFIYLHECKVIYNSRIYEKRQNLHKKLTTLFPKHNLLVASQKQGEFYEQSFNLSPNPPKAVYNFIKPTNLAKPIRQCNAIQFPSDQIHIIMVGSLQERKGTSFFSQVADFAKLHEKNWEFYWVGDGSHTHNLYLSPQVHWLGHRPPEEVQYIIAQSSIFFLSSTSECFPLTICEALLAKKPCVAFKDGVGAYYELKNFREVVLFDSYKIASAIKAIERAIALKSFDPTGKLQNHLTELLSPENYITRMNNIIGI